MYETEAQATAHRLAQQSIPIQPCEVCGTTVNVHRHHDDYSKPLKIRFLCPKHHKQVHPSNTAQNKGDVYPELAMKAGKPYSKKLVSPEMLARHYTDNTEQKTAPTRRLRLKTIANRQAAKISEEDLEFIRSL